mmetsp:Transcript_35335/g.59554  ORF Transcript_35335/g.59554 Transcript_35335/m.59554 type:complete len:243 (+) Transcript_35335:274-1002(+)
MPPRTPSLVAPFLPGVPVPLLSLRAACLACSSLLASRLALGRGSSSSSSEDPRGSKSSPSLCFRFFPPFAAFLAALASLSLVSSPEGSSCFHWHFDPKSHSPFTKSTHMPPVRASCSFPLNLTRSSFAVLSGASFSSRIFLRSSAFACFIVRTFVDVSLRRSAPSLPPFESNLLLFFSFKDSQCVRTSSRLASADPDLAATTPPITVRSTTSIRCPELSRMLTACSAEVSSAACFRRTAHIC